METGWEGSVIYENFLIISQPKINNAQMLRNVREKNIAWKLWEKPRESLNIKKAEFTGHWTFWKIRKSLIQWICDNYNKHKSVLFKQRWLGVMGSVIGRICIGQQSVRASSLVRGF